MKLQLITYSIAILLCYGCLPENLTGTKASGKIKYDVLCEDYSNRVGEGFSLCLMPNGQKCWVYRGFGTGGMSCNWPEDKINRTNRGTKQHEL